MERLQEFECKLMPNGDQQRNMRRVAGSCRYVFNKALAMKKGRYERGGNLAMPDCARL
jgi:putative transposase